MPARPYILIATLLTALPWTATALERSELLPQMQTHLQITDLSGFREGLDQTYLRELRADEQYQAFSVASQKKIKTMVADGKIPLGMRLIFEQLRILKGEVIFAGDILAPGTEKAPLYVAAAMSKEEHEQSLDHEDWLQSSGASAPVGTAKSSFQGVDIILSIVNADTPEEESFWRAYVNGTLLLSNEPEWIKECIVKLENETITEPDGNKLSCRLPLGKWLRSTAKQKGDATAQLRTENLYEALGLMGISDYLFDVEMTDAELIVDGHLLIADTKKGLFSLLDTTPVDLPTDGLIPPVFSSFSTGKIDLQNIWKNLPEILPAFPRNAAVQFVVILKHYQQQTGLDVEHDLLAHIGKQYVLLTVTEEDKQNLLTALELHDETAFNTSLTTLFASPLAQSWAGFMSTTDFRGHTVYSIKATAPDANPPALCAAGNYLLIGNASLIREAILRMEYKTKPRPSRMQRMARQHAPATAFGLGVTDLKKTSSLLDIKVSDSSFSAGLGIKANKEPAEKLGPNEISFNYITSFLTTAYHFAEATDQGIHHRIIFEHSETEGEK